jgi:hypothetical protein
MASTERSRTMNRVACSLVCMPPPSERTMTAAIAAHPQKNRVRLAWFFRHRAGKQENTQLGSSRRTVTHNRSRLRRPNPTSESDVRVRIRRPSPTSESDVRPPPYREPPSWSDDRCHPSSSTCN